MRYDISKFVIDGENDIRVILGCGWFAQQKRSAEGFAKYGDIKLCYKIDVENKSGKKYTFVSYLPPKTFENQLFFCSTVCPC